MAQNNFTIGILAEKSGATIETIRFYQRRGLLAEPAKPSQGVRRYSEHDVQRVRYIKQGQKLGFSLAEISELLSLEEERHCGEAKEIALRKLILIRERIEGLISMETALSNLVKKCGSTGAACPIIHTLLGRSE